MLGTKWAKNLSFFFEVHPMNYYITVTIRCYKFQAGPKIKLCEDVSLKMPGASFFWGAQGKC